MTTEFALAQLRHLYSLMLAGHVKDTGEAARGLLGPSIEALEKAALSSPPEDVARDVEAVRKALRDGVQDENLLWDPPSPLSRLATAAARVSGLEAEVSTLTSDKAMAHKYAETLTAERDAYKRDMDAEIAGTLALRKELGAKDSEGFPDFVRRLASERDAARGNADDWKVCAEREVALRETAEKERATARQEVETLTGYMADVTEALLGERPKGVMPSTTLDKARDLTARVAELEQERKSLDLRVCAGEQNLRSAQRTVVYANENGARAASERDREKARADEAEARATAAEAKVRELTETLERKQMAIHGLMETAATPTPAPGLREAVGPFAAWSRELVEFFGDSTPETQKVAWMGGHVFTLGHVRALLSAYESAPEPVVTHAQIAAVVDALRSEAPFDGYPVAQKALDEVLRRVTGGEVPRVLTEARVVEALVDMANEDNTGKEDPESAMAEAHSDGWTACALEALERLGLTLPTGPGGGEHTAETKCSRCGKRRCEHDLMTDEMTWHCAIAGTPLFAPEHSTPRARIAPTPKITNKDDSNDD